MTYYERHREEVKAYNRERYSNMSEEKKAELKAYQKAYFQENKDLIAMRQKAKRVVKPPKPAPPPKPVKQPKQRQPKPKRSKQPKPYSINIVEEPFGFGHLASYQKNLMKDIAPSGWYERPADENPFVLQFT